MSVQPEETPAGAAGESQTEEDPPLADRSDSYRVSMSAAAGGGAASPPPADADVEAYGGGAAPASPDRLVGTSTWDKVTVVDDLSSFPGDNVDNKVAKFTETHQVVVFSKTRCPFSIEVKKTFESLNVPFAVYEINRAKEGSDVFRALKSSTKHQTVPNVFIKGKHVGGCNDVKALQSSGELDDLIRDLVLRTDNYLEEGDTQHRLATVKGAKKKRGEAIQPLLWFPNVVNGLVNQLTGILVVASCAIGIAFREDYWSRWWVTMILMDFIARFSFGAFPSPLGMIATVLATPFTPKFKPGPPKQFAAFCGICFSLPATALYHADEDIAGPVILGLLMGAAALEGFFDFCLGCLFFGWGIDLGLIPPAVYRIYANTRENVKGAWEYANITCAKATPPTETVHAGEQSPADLRYKRVKTDEHTISDFHLVRNMQVSYFAMPLSLAGLAVAFKLASPWLDDFVGQKTGSTSGNNVETYNVHDDVWRTLATIAAVVYMIMLCLYAARLVLYTRKCSKEWHSPLQSPSFGMITISCTLFSFLVYDQLDDAHFGRALFWMGSVTHALLTVAKFGEWIGKRYEMEHVHPSWIILPVGGFVSALVAPIVPAIIDTPGVREIPLGTNQNIELANFYYSFAYFMWIVLFTITFYKTVTSHNSDDRIRNQIFIWIAPPAVASVADFIICFSRATTAAAPVTTGQCVHNFSQLYWVAIVLEVGLLWAFLPYINFFGRAKFGMSYWAFGFSLDVVAAASCLFYAVTDYMMAEALFLSTLAIAAAANLLTILHTIAALLRRRGVFTPEIKWGPLSFMKLTHEGFRGAVPRLKGCLEALDVTNRDSVMDFAVDFAKFSTAHHEHAAHEDEVIFREFERYFPEHARTWLDDHEQDRVFLADLSAKIDQVLAFAGKEKDAISEADANAILAELKEKIPPFLEHFHEHLEGEEANLNPVGRKYVPLAVQKQLVKRVWEATPTTAWEVIIPYVLENLPRIPQRVRYLKALIWGLGGERAQMLGYIVYKNCDAVMWEVLTQELPEIIPRGVRGWCRYY